MADLVPFDAFRKQIESSKLDDHAETVERALEQRGQVVGGASRGIGDAGLDVGKELERMREFLSVHYEGTSAAHSFVDEGGRIVDCIPFEQQPTVQSARKLGIDVMNTAPPLPPNERAISREVGGEGDHPPAASMTPPLAKGIKDAGGNTIEAPPGTVPVRRITIDRLARNGQLENFFKKGPPNRQLISQHDGTRDIGGPSPFTPQPGPDGFIHLHAGVQCPPSPSGGYSASSAFLSVWRPDIRPGSMSLSQLWILSQNPAPNGNPTTVEGGWQVLSGPNPDPVLFVFFNPDGYGPRSGYGTNRNGEGFITFESAQWTPGGSIGKVSTIGGPQVGFVMEWVLGDLGWILYMGNDSGSLAGVGYFPKEYYTNGLANGAGFLQFGGEVANIGPASVATGQMGSGNKPANPLNSGFQKVAFQYELSVRNLGESTLSPATGLMPFGEATDCYVAAPGSSSTWGSHFWFGGAKAP